LHRRDLGRAYCADGSAAIGFDNTKDAAGNPPRVDGRCQRSKSAIQGLFRFHVISKCLFSLGDRHFPGRGPPL
jgi:hypothetical protein